MENVQILLEIVNTNMYNVPIDVSQNLCQHFRLIRRVDIIRTHLIMPLKQ